MNKKFNLVLITVVAITLLISGSIMAKDWKEIDPPGYYNLDQFEELTGEAITSFNDAPMLEAKVKSGELPPVEDRLPENPLVLMPWKEIGKYGGTIKWDWFQIDGDPTLYFLNEADLLNLSSPTNISWGMGPWLGETQPGVLAKYETNDDYTVHTFTIRKGLKWSDGAPVTTDDVDYYIREVLMNKEITPSAPEFLRYPSGNAIKTKLEIVDDYTFKLVFAEPYPTFYHKFRSHPTYSWSYLIRPKHYLKQFHRNYTSEDKLLTMMKEEGFETMDDWGTFYDEVVGGAPTSGGSLGLAEDAIGYPTLSPYVVTEVKENGDFVFERNPYFFMVDPAGNQLPYIDRLERKYVQNKEMINMDIISGNTDLQRDLNIQDYPLFAKNKEQGNYRLAPSSVRDNIQYLIWYINMAYKDENYRKYFQELKFREALSFALDREQIKENLFMGFGRPAQFAAIPGTPYYEEGMEEAYADYNPEKAKQLLKELGLVDKDGDGYVDFPNGDPFIIQFEVTEFGAPTVPGAEMAQRYWKNIGLRVDVKQVDMSYYWQLHDANEMMMGSWWGHGMDPTDPYHLGLQMSTPEWRRWYLTDGEEGIEPLPWAKELLDAQKAFENAMSKEEAIKAGTKMWRIQSQYIPVLGAVAEPRVPFVYSKDLGNIGEPKEIMDYAQKTIMQPYPTWYFTNPDRRK